MRNIDSKNPFSRFDCCAFLLASYSSPQSGATFARYCVEIRRFCDGYHIRAAVGRCNIPHRPATAGIRGRQANKRAAEAAAATRALPPP
jgi:hypothetical protein